MPSGPPPPPGMTNLAPAPVAVTTTSPPPLVTAPAPAPTPTPTPAPVSKGVDLTPDEEARRQKLLAAATWYTSALGLTLVPSHYPINGQCSCGRGEKCDSPAKHPNARPGFHTDPDQQVRTPRDAENAWAERPWNICILLGAHRGVFAFDVDPRAGGIESLEKLKRDLDGVLDFDATYHYHTSSGGTHYYFKVDVDDMDSWRKISKLSRVVSLYKGVDYKIHKGYTIAAPSLHISGDHYTRPPTAPQTITELSAADVDRYERALLTANGKGGAKMTSAIPSSFSDMLEVASSATEGVGIALGGTQTYENSIKELANLEQGAASRILSHFLFYNTVPNDPYRLRDGEWNEQFYILISKVAAYLFRDAGMSAEYHYMWLRAGGEPGARNRRRNRIFPGLYRMICEGLSTDISDPPYHQAKPEKFYGIMSDVMFLEWQNHGLDV